MEFYEGHEPEDCRVCVEVEAQRRREIKAFAFWQRETGRPSLFDAWSNYVNHLILAFKQEAKRG